MQRRRKVVVLGDSHAKIFRDPAFRSFPARFEVTAISGATLSGLTNPRAVTRAGPIIDERLTAGETHPPHAIVILLGEVDCGFVIWWHHEQHGRPLQDGIDRALKNLEHLVEEARRLAPVIVVSAPLPTIADAQNFSGDANLRHAILANQRERTELVLAFNRGIRELATNGRFHFLDLDHASLGVDGTVSPLLVHPNPREHHYDRATYARLLVRELGELDLFSRSSR